MSYLPCFRRCLALARDRRSLFPKRARSFSLQILQVHWHDERYTVYFYFSLLIIRAVPQSFAHEIRRRTAYHRDNIPVRLLTPVRTGAYQPKENQTSIHPKCIFHVFPSPFIIFSASPFILPFQNSSIYAYHILERNCNEKK